MNDIRQQINTIRGYHNLDCDAWADTMEKMLAVVEAAETYYDNVGLPSATRTRDQFRAALTVLRGHNDG